MEVIEELPGIVTLLSWDIKAKIQRFTPVMMSQETNAIPLGTPSPRTQFHEDSCAHQI
jgi:hypothetical protein